MNILYVTQIDLIGRRFNGYDVMTKLRENGINAKQMVIEKFSKDKNVIDLSQNFSNFHSMMAQIYDLEYELSYRAMLFPYGKIIENHPCFLNADIVHYHLFQNGVMSLSDFSRLTRKKKSVLTIHDCTLLTGHCVYPMKCQKWKNGCGDCPDLDRQFKIKRDMTAVNWAVREKIFNEAELELIVGSEWMGEKVKQSPFLQRFELHHIPFGIDVNFYAKKRENARKILGIPEDEFVLFFRAQYEQKSLKEIKEAVYAMKKKPFLLTCALTGVFDDYAGGKLEMGSITYDEKMALCYAACDLFLMPSIGESFGFMGIECMASGKPIIVAEDTALPMVTFSPECGIVVPQSDSVALQKAIEKLMENPQECKQRGELGQELAYKHYLFENYYQKHLELYQSLM